MEPNLTMPNKTKTQIADERVFKSWETCSDWDKAEKPRGWSGMSNDERVLFRQKFERINRTSTPFTVARDYFYPNGYWDGLNKFFKPSVGTRAGDELISSIRAALNNDGNAGNTAISILQRPHTKRVTHLKGVAPHNVTCFPTPEAAKAVSILTILLGWYDRPDPQPSHPTPQTKEKE